MKIKEEVINVLKNVDIKDEELRITEKLDRKLYQETAKVLKAMGGRYVSGKRATVFPEGTDLEGTISEICETKTFTSLATKYQFFPTPDELAKEIVKRAGIKPDDICLEPSAGRGNIAKYLTNCDCVELNEDNRRFLKANGYNVIHDDFMTFVPNKEYDVIVMNPPFCKCQDAAHIYKAIEIAKRKVVAIGGSGIMYRNDKAYCRLRELVERYKGTIEPLPEKAFKDSGTNVNTCLIVVDKQGN